MFLSAPLYLGIVRQFSGGFERREETFTLHCQACGTTLLSHEHAPNNKASVVLHQDEDSKSGSQLYSYLISLVLDRLRIGQEDYKTGNLSRARQLTINQF